MKKCKQNNIRNKNWGEMETQEGTSSHEVKFRAGGGGKTVLTQMS